MLRFNWQVAIAEGLLPGKAGGSAEKGPRDGPASQFSSAAASVAVSKHRMAGAMECLCETMSNELS